MTKRLSLFVMSVLLAVAAYAQPTNLPAGVTARFFTSFENPNPFDSTISVGTTGWGWNPDPAFQFPTGTGGQAIRGRYEVNGTTTLTTLPFSTLGQFKVWLDFAHICKIELLDSAVVQISTNGGTTWQTLQGQNCLYLGGSADFRNSNRFSHLSYLQLWEPSNLTITPLATWWRQERFDITAIASNQADVRIRFRLRDNNGTGMGGVGGGTPAYGWLVDSVLVTSAFSEIIPPIITHTPLTGLQFNIGQNITATVRDSFGCDSTGVLDSWLFYKINGGPIDSAQMVRQGTTLLWSFNLDTSRVVDGDTIQYFIRARDSSPRQNIRYFPNMTTPGDTFITYYASIFPTIANHTPIVGRQFSAGPFAFSANISDASGIDSAILHYRFNSGPWQLRKMPLISGILYRDSLAPLDGDTVDYYIEAVDNSIRRFRRAIPDTAAFWRFIASGKPDVTWPNSSAQCDVFLGALFELGPFNIGVKAEDGSGIDTVILYYRVNNGAFDSVGMVRNTTAGAFCNWIGTVPAVSDSDTVAYYVKAIDASSRSNFRISPDSGQVRQFVALAGIRFPYVDGFDASDAWRSFIASGSVLSPTTVPGGWVRGTPAKSTINSARSAPNAWVTGPINADYPNNAWYILETPVFDFSTAQNATLSFWQWRNINNGSGFGNGDGFWIDYSTNINATTPTWTRLGTALATDTNQTGWYNVTNLSSFTHQPGGQNAASGWDGVTNGWVRSERRLIEPAFQGANGAGSIRFRFVFRSNASLQANGVAIDDFSIVLPKQRDIAVTTIASNAQSTPIQPSNNNFQVIAGDPLVIFARLRNFGLAVLDTVVPIVVEVGSYKDTTYLNTGAIQPNAFTFNSLRLDTIPAAPARWFTVKIYSILPGDEDRLNDTLEVQMYGVPTVSVPHTDNFDGVDNWLPLATGTNPIVWERGAPTGSQLGAPASAPNVWGTVLAGNPANNISGYLLSPLFNFNNAVNTTLRFKMNRRMLAGAGIRISFADGLFTNWQTLGAVNDGAGINWYNAPTAAIAGVTGPAWTGQSPTFTTHTLELPAAFNYRTGRGVRFRLDFQNNPTGGAEGVVIDDWEIVPPPAREIGLLSFVGPVACPDSVRAIDTIRVIIRNFGGDTIYSVPFNYTFNNGPLQLANDFIYNDTIPPAATRIVTILPGFISPQPAGNYDLRVFARLSNDARRSNDTIVRCIKTIPPLDLLMVRAISPPNSICFPSGPREVKFLIRNIGNSASSTFTAGFRLDSLPPVTQTVNLVIPPNGFDTVTISVPVNIPNGTSTLKMFVNSNADPVRTNDTLSVQITGRIPITLTHIDDFERNTPLQYCLFSGVNARLEIRDNLISANNPSGKALFMGTFASGTTFNVNIPPDPWVDTWNGPWLTKVAFPVETDNRDSIRIRFRLLQIAGSNNAVDRISLFRVVANGRQIGATLQPTGATPANNPYVQYDLRLDTVYNAGEPLLIEFQSKTRYTLSTTGTSRNGNFVDDVIIYNAMPHGAEVMEVTYTPPFPSATTPVTALARVRNTGTNVLNTVQLNLVVNGTTIQTVNAPLNLPFMKDTLYAFTTTFNPLLGSNDICVFSASPNGQQDGFPQDDTACTEAIGFPVIGSFPYCNDFDSNLPEWLTRNPFTLRNAGNSWYLGTPDKGFINGTASGANAWYIGPDSLYGAYDSSALYTPIFEVVSGECYRISFKTKFLEDFWNNDPNGSPLLGDGGTLEYSTDGGANFTNFGRLDTFANEWYNNSVFSLRDFNSMPNSLGLGWSAKSDSSWMTMRQIFNTTSNTLVLFRFRHGSDDAFHGEGFAVDDFCFEVVPGPCGLVSVEEAELAGFELKQNYPNPFANRTTFEYVLPSNGEVDVYVKDMLGRTIYSKSEGMLGEGSHFTELDLTRMEAGVYFYTVTFNGMSLTKKMIISK